MSVAEGAVGEFPVAASIQERAVARLLDSPLGRKAISEELAATEAARRRRIEERLQRVAQRQAHGEERARQLQRVQRESAELRAALAASVAQEAALSWDGECFFFDREIARLELELTAARPEPLAAFLRELVDVEQAVRDRVVIAQDPTPRALGTGHAQMWTNADGVSAAIAVVRDALGVASELTFEALEGSQLESRLAKLRSAVSAAVDAIPRRSPWDASR